MSDMKCPICGKPMKQATYDYDKKDNDDTLYMSIMPCDCVCSYGASRAVWQALIRTRKALDVAKDTFNWIDETYRTGQEMEAEIWGRVQLAAQQITALEQKD